MSIFTKIVSGEIPSYKIAEDDNYLAFLDINPNTKGHTLVIPKKEINKLFDLDQKDYLDLMRFSYRVAKAIEKTVPCKRIGMSVIGLEVPHVHVHLIPINTMNNMRFVEKEKLTSNEFESLAKDISSNFS
ncbi:HIT domain-containing protein [Flavobacteriaceae bacterium]|nr:HIT domain-containing protein [Flavobacteriaceae bacterium]MDC1167322.1 HIT domain-containing protein [Flavobacteriaceae bacterium]